MSLFATASHEPLLRRVDEGADPFLVQVKGFVFLISQVLDVVNVDKPI